MVSVIRKPDAYYKTNPWNEIGTQELCMSIPLPNPTPCSAVALTISAKKLQDKDVFSKSDPVCVVYRYSRRAGNGKQLNQGEWREAGRTELIMNCLNPEFTKQIMLEYFFEEKQPLRFEFYDIDNVNKGLDAQDFLGKMECDLAEIVSVGVFTRPLTGLPGNCGTITVACEEVDAGHREHIRLECNAIKVDRKDFFGKSDPFLKIYRINDDGSRVMVHRTEFLKRTLNPTWKPFEINMATLCGGDRTRNIHVECWDDNLQFNPDYIGHCQVNMGELLETKRMEVPLINEKKQAKKGKKYKNSGILVLNAQAFKVPTFLDYIAGGTQLDFMVAVDFTASNLPPHDPKSLHFLGRRPNQYEVAIRAVLEICQYYNRGKNFDAYGFGAMVPGQGKVAPLFTMSDPKPALTSPSVIGVQGVMSAYETSVRTVKFYGPTNFAPIVQQAARKTTDIMKAGGSKYQILLIVTDGCISDMMPTKKAIVEASGLPLSIIIIGVGNAEFDNMDELDGDNVRLSHNGRFAERDIVQFVPMNEFLGNSGSTGIPENVMAALAKEVLAEVPLQLTSYMRSRGIEPQPPREEPAWQQNGSYPSVPTHSNAPQQSSFASAPPVDINDVGFQPSIC